MYVAYVHILYWCIDTYMYVAYLHILMHWYSHVCGLCAYTDVLILTCTCMDRLMCTYWHYWWIDTYMCMAYVHITVDGEGRNCTQTDEAHDYTQAANEFTQIEVLTIPSLPMHYTCNECANTVKDHGQLESTSAPSNFLWNLTISFQTIKCT